MLFQGGQQIGKTLTVRELGYWMITKSSNLATNQLIALVGARNVTATAGTLIPLGLRALKIDPALASSVFITTLTDVFGFLSFLGLALLRSARG